MYFFSLNPSCSPRLVRAEARQDVRGVEVMLKVSKCCPCAGNTNKIPLGNRCDSQEVIKIHNQNWVKQVTGEKTKEISCLVGRRDRPSEGRPLEENTRCTKARQQKKKGKGQGNLEEKVALPKKS